MGDAHNGKSIRLCCLSPYDVEEDPQTPKGKSSIVATRVLYSAPCYCLYISMIVINVFLIVATFTVPKRRPWTGIILSLEIVVNLFLISEVTLRLIAERRKYWDKCWNVFDFVVMLLCLGSLLVDLRFAFGHGWHNSPEEVLAGDVSSTSLQILRNSLRVLRLLALVKNQRKNQVPDKTGIYFSKYTTTSRDERSNSGVGSDEEERWLLERDKNQQLIREASMPPQDRQAP